MSKGALIFASTVSMALSAGAWAGTEGASSTFYGQGAGAAGNPASGDNTYMGTNAGNAAVGAGNTFIGRSAGLSATTGGFGVFIGRSAGQSVTTGTLNTLVGVSAGGGLTVGGLNTMVGAYAGSQALGEYNVFLGYGAGAFEAGSNKLYIDNCVGASFCERPLIYGEFDTRLLAVDGVMRVTANRTLAAVKSQLHFSVTGADEGGWLTSASANNFFTSSGARYDADAGGWIQRSADGKAVISGSGAAGFRVLTSSGGAVGGVVVPVSRLHIDFDGLMGVNAAPAAGRAINTSTGAYLSSGGVWTNASSRALKRNVQPLSTDRAMQAFRELEPVTFEYANEASGHVGFIAEDVPALVATPDRKGLASMDVVAVLTKVLQEKSRVIERQEARFAELEARFEALAAEVRRKH